MSIPSEADCSEGKLPGTLAVELSSQLTATGSVPVPDAIDDSADADDATVKKKRELTKARLEQHTSKMRLIRKVVPFHWAPMLAPLVEDDVDACVALELDAVADERQLNLETGALNSPEGKAATIREMVRGCFCSSEVLSAY